MRNQLRLILVAAAVALVPTAGCIIDNGHGDDVAGPVCDGTTAYEIDTNQTFAYTPGVDAGYYITYVGAGAWHLEWTCDTNLSSDGCNFSGTIVADEPTSGANATCFQCESNDELSAGDAHAPGPAGEPQMEIDFNTLTTTGVDGVDFTSVDGSSIELDIQVNGLDQEQLIYFVSGGADAAPSCMPFALTPMS